MNLVQEDLQSSHDHSSILHNNDMDIEPLSGGDDCSASHASIGNENTTATDSASDSDEDSSVASCMITDDNDAQSESNDHDNDTGLEGEPTEEARQSENEVEEESHRTDSPQTEELNNICGHSKCSCAFDASFIRDCRESSSVPREMKPCLVVSSFMIYRWSSR